MEKVPVKLFLSEPNDFLGETLSLSLKENGYEMIDDVDTESNVIIHNSEALEFCVNHKDEDVFNRINYEGTKSLCAAIDKWSIKPSAFIYLSSVSVYGSKGGELITENHPLNGNTAYSKSKIMAEDFLIEWAYKAKVTLCILRLPKIIVGKKTLGMLGKIIEAIRSGKYVGIGRGRSKKSAIWAEDIITLIPKISDIEGIYNLTDGYHPTNRELEVLICNSLGKKLPFKIPSLLVKPMAWIGDLTGDRFPLNSEKLEEITTTLTFDDRKARKAFDWKPSNVLEKLGEVL